MARRLYYNITNTCDNIKEDGKKCENKLKPLGAYRECDEKENWTGRWLCKKCYMKDYYRYIIKNDPNNQSNIKKRLANRRTGNQNPNSSQAKGDKFEELTCIWRGVKNLNIENDNYRFSIDHSRDPELGIIQTKGRLYDHINRLWNFDTHGDCYKDFDNMICYCVSKDGKYIERIYIFPKEEVIKRGCVSIVKNPLPSRGPFWYEEYRVKDEDALKIVNDIWKYIINRKRVKKIIKEKNEN